MTLERIYRVFWIAVFVTIIAVGVPTVAHPDSALPLRDFGRDGSVNSVLENTLNEANASEQITEWLGGLPRGRAILVVAPPNNMSAALTADLVSYLAWPRAVVVTSEPEKTRRLLATAREHFCAIGLCYVAPPDGTKVSKSFGPALTFIGAEPR
jgi:hypothetical protein